MRIRLTHNCGYPGAVGMPGDVIVATPEAARVILERGGAVAVDEPEASLSKRPTGREAETAAVAPVAEKAVRKRGRARKARPAPTG